MLRQQHSTRVHLESNPADQSNLIAASVPRGRRRIEVILPMKSKTKTAAPLAKPVAPYIGGKRNLAKRVCAIIDAHDHTSYAEPFVGMGGIFLRRKTQARAEFINDKGRDVYNLFRMLQEHYTAFLDMLKYQITTQANFMRLVSVDPETLTDLQRAARFLYVQRIGFGGQVARRTFGLSKALKGRFNLTTLEPDLEALHERLAGVTVLCLDFGEFIRRVDRKGALFYLDPPYWGSEGDYGKDAFSREDFARLSDQLKSIKGSFLMSINDQPEIREQFKWAQMVSVKTTYSLPSGKPQNAVGKLLIASSDVDLTQLS